MSANWTVKHGKPDHDFLATMETALATQNILSASTTKIIVGGGGNTVVLRGLFTLDGADPVSGEVHTVRVFEDGKLLAVGKGFHLPVADIGDAFDDLAGGDFGTFLLLFFQRTEGLAVTFPGRVTVNLSDDRDVFEAPGIGAMTIYGNKGNDKITGASGSDVVFPALQNKIYGGAGNDTLTGGNSYAYDLLVGGKGKDKLYGLDGNDVLKGGKGKDVLDGGAGDDKLFGGPGADQFLFTTALGNGIDEAGNNRIMDFQPGIDSIGLDSTVFSAIGAKLNKGEFHVGGNAKEANHHIIYKKKTGELFYDADGAGGAPKVKFAELKGKPAIDHTDFFVI